MRRLDKILIIWTLLYINTSFIFMFLVDLDESKEVVISIQVVWIFGLVNLWGSNLHHKRIRRWLQEKVK